MKLKKLFFNILYILIAFTLLVNIIGIVLYKNGGLYFLIINAIFIIAIFIYVFVLTKKIQKDNDASVETEQKNISLIKQLQKFDKLVKDCINTLIDIRMKLEDPIYENKELNVNEINNNKVLAVITKTDDDTKQKEKSKEINQMTHSSVEEYRKIYEEITQSINYDKLSDIPTTTTKIKETIMRIYVKLPYLIKLLDNIRGKSEGVILNLIDKFNLVSEANAEAGRDAVKNIEFLKNVHGGKDFNQVARDSKEAYKKTKDFTKTLIQLNKDNRKKFDKIDTWIKQINQMLKNIQDISEQNKVIAINSSIEAARIGEAGQGFRVLVQEIQSLNTKTGNFTREINQIMNEFEKYNQEFINEWDVQTKDVIQHIENIIDSEEKTINKFIESFELTIKSFQELSESTFKVEKNLDEILQSLQFEDITEQQVRHVKEFLNDIYEELSNKNNYFKKMKIQLNNISNELDNKIREELSQRVTVIDEKHILEG